MCRRGHNLILHTFACHPTSDSTEYGPLIQLIIGIRSSFETVVRIQLCTSTSTLPGCGVCPKRYVQPVHAKDNGRGSGMFYHIRFLFDSYITTYVFERHLEDNSRSTSEKLEEWVKKPSQTPPINFDLSWCRPPVFLRHLNPSFLLTTPP